MTTDDSRSGQSREDAAFSEWRGNLFRLTYFLLGAAGAAIG
ncbi:MAG: hypothetical protein WEF50_23390 [Myxococcota bacterium]